jgi:hypothetical protein
MGQHRIQVDQNTVFMSTRPPQKVDHLPHYVLFFLHVIIYFISFTLVLMALQFFLQITLVKNEYAILISLFVSIATAIVLFRRVHRYAWRTLASGTLLILGFIVTTGWVSGLVFDKSWDGMAYHQIAILEMAEGWNPFYEKLPSQWQESKYYDRLVDLRLWVNHYSKGHEMFAAAVFALTDNIENGKVINLLLLFAAFCSTWYLLSHLGNFSPFWKVAIALASALNPIAVNQMFSYFLDGAVASCILILITQLVLFFIADDAKHRLLSLAMMGLISLILINLKFTGLLYHAWISFIFLCFLIYHKRLQLIKQFVLAMSVSGVVAIVVTGFNPYVTNTLGFGHPFYPVAGPNKVDAMTHMIPPGMEQQNRIGRFVTSTFARCDNVSAGSSKPIRYKFPFTMDAGELRVLQSEGIRLGGFGVWWSGIFLLAMLTTAWLLVSGSRAQRIRLIFLLLAIVGSAFIIPVAWWARFVPQLWLLPIAVLIFLFASKSAPAQVTAKLMVLLLLINSGMIAGVYTYSVYTNTKNAYTIFAGLKQTGKPVYLYTDIFSPNALKLTSYDIPFIHVSNYDELGCTNPVGILRMEMCPRGDGHKHQLHVHAENLDN